MKAKLICYTLGKLDHKNRSKFKREFLGYMDKSNNGKYKYLRQGILSTIPYYRPIRSVVIVEEQYEKRVTQFLKKFKATIWLCDVIIDKNELKTPQGMTP